LGSPHSLRAVFGISKNDEVSTILAKKWWFLSTILDKRRS
jgi:hypothetical protein